MNRGELVTEVGEKLGFSYDVDGSYEQNYLRDLANRAVVDVLLKTHIYIQLGDADLTAGVSEYRLDSNILAIDDGRGSTPAGIGHYVVVGLDEMIARQSAGIVSPTYRKVIAMEGDLLIVDPVPETDESLRFYYVPKPQDMTNDSDDPAGSVFGGIPTQHHSALTYYMLWQGAEYDDKEAPMKPLEYRAVYRDLCTEIQEARRRLRGRRRPGPPQIGYPDTKRALLGRNDIYYSGR